MRNYLNNVEIVGAVMCYQEGQQCRWSLDWLVSNCDRILILLDNWDEPTEKIVLEYKDKYPEIVRVIYSTDPVRPEKNIIQGQTKKRYKIRQPYIREQVIVELKKIHEEKAINILVWPDSDETFINEFPKYLEDFWYRQPNHDFMMTGFVEVYESMRILISQKMAPHGRVYRFNPAMTALPYSTRTVYHPYEFKKPWKVRNLVIHLCHFNEEYRKRRQFFDNKQFDPESRVAWLLPKDVREMTVTEIADYQPGIHQAPSKYPPILLTEFINNKDKYYG